MKGIGRRSNEDGVLKTCLTRETNLVGRDLEVCRSRESINFGVKVTVEELPRGEDGTDFVKEIVK